MNATNNTTSHDVDTRAEAGADKITTALTIKWDEMTLEETRALAAQSIVIKWQGQVRKAGVIPTEVSLNATDYRLGVRAPRKPADVASMLAKLSPEELAAVLARFAK